jgi:ABC-type multidrug transport system fused ATPase/permease subunit
MGFVVWRWSRGLASAGDVVFVSTLLAQLFRPLDLLGMVYRTIRQGALDMAAMFDLIDTPASVVDVADAHVQHGVDGAHVADEAQRRLQVDERDGVGRAAREGERVRARAALEHLGRVVSVAALRKVQRMPKELAHLQRQSHQVFFAAA